MTYAAPAAFNLSATSTLLEEPAVPYTLRSRNRLLGTSELAYRRSFPRLRVGDFAPTELGEQLMAIILGVGPALNALYDVSDRVRREQRKKGIRRCEELAEADPDIDFEDCREPWEPEPPRYQIYVELPGHDKWMRRVARRRNR